MRNLVLDLALPLPFLQASLSLFAYTWAVSSFPSASVAIYMLGISTFFSTTQIFFSRVINSRLLVNSMLNVLYALQAYCSQILTVLYLHLCDALFSQTWLKMPHSPSTTTTATIGQISSICLIVPFNFSLFLTSIFQFCFLIISCFFP